MAANARTERGLPRAGHVALIADDDAGMRDVLRSLLNEAGYAVIAAASGQEVLELAGYIDASVAILDLAMPNGDGLHTCKALRRIDAWREVPILILTNHHTDKALQAARRAGATGFVCKPFVPSQLLRRIASLTGQGNAEAGPAPMVWGTAPAVSSADAEPDGVSWERTELAQQDESRFSTARAVLQAYRNIDPAHPTPPARFTAKHERAVPRHVRVLVAEDEELTQEIVVHILSQEGYLVDRAGNGQEALAAVIRGEYDLVLMDVNMPGLSGIEAARTIRSLPNKKARVPIVAMTANAFHLYADEMRAAGMNGYLMKPISASALISCVHERFGSVPSTAACQRSGYDQVLDVQLLREEAKHFAPGAIGRFLDGLAASINETLPMVQGWISSDPVDLRWRLHNLAGVAGTLGCTRLSEVARKLETARAVDDELIEQFADAAKTSLAAIRQYLA